MKHTKEFFGVLFSVLICVFLVALGVYAVTTVSEDVDIDTGKLVTGHDAILEHALQVGHTATAAYSRFGNGTTDHSLAADDDALFIGLVEFNDQAYFDAVANFDSTVSVSDGDITFYNGATINNSAGAELLTFTESQIDIVGYATVSQDFQVEGNLDAMGVASVAGQTYLYDALNFSDGGTIDNSDATTLQITEAQIDIVGYATVSQDFQVENNLSVMGTASVSGTAYFDGVVSVSDANGLDMSGGSTIFGDAASPSGNCTLGDVHINSLANSGTGANRVISVCDVANEWTAIGQ